MTYLPISCVKPIYFHKRFMVARISVYTNYKLFWVYFNQPIKLAHELTVYLIHVYYRKHLIRLFTQKHHKWTYITFFQVLLWVVFILVLNAMVNWSHLCHLNESSDHSMLILFLPDFFPAINASYWPLHVPWCFLTGISFFELRVVLLNDGWYVIVL